MLSGRPGGPSILEYVMNMEHQLSVIKRGIVDIISEEELRKKLVTGRPLTIKAGFDPTAPDIHLGHTVLLRKLRQFQDLGHQIKFLIGDYTARIGDPSGRSELRKPLSEEQVQANATTYQDQAFKILNPEKTTVCFNSTWMSKLSASDLIMIASKYNVARMLEREDFNNRYKKGFSIAIHEFLYPLIQGYDSVALKADVEIGGTDQKFNLLVGRDLQREFGQEPQVIITLPLLDGTNGVEKMSKSLNNYIGIEESPDQIFGKVMSISDTLMWQYYTLLSDLSIHEITNLQNDVQYGKIHPKEVKKNLAKELVGRFHGRGEADDAESRFEQVFKEKKAPEQMPEVSYSAGVGPSIVQIMVDHGLAKSNSEARRLIAQGGVRLDENVIKDVAGKIGNSGTHVLNVGKRKFLKIKNS